MAKQKAKTRKDDLRTGTPFWVKTPHSTVGAQRTLTRDRFDVIAIGLGISGALVAEALTRAGKSVLILDRRPPVGGSPPASTAMIQHEIDVPLTRLRRQIGKDHADKDLILGQPFLDARKFGDFIRYQTAPRPAQGFDSGDQGLRLCQRGSHRVRSDMRLADR